MKKTSLNEAPKNPFGGLIGDIKNWQASRQAEKLIGQPDPNWPGMVYSGKLKDGRPHSMPKEDFAKSPEGQAHAKRISDEAAAKAADVSRKEAEFQSRQQAQAAAAEAKRAAAEARLQQAQQQAQQPQQPPKPEKPGLLDRMGYGTRNTPIASTATTAKQGAAVTAAGGAAAYLASDDEDTPKEKQGTTVIQKSAPAAAAAPAKPSTPTDLTPKKVQSVPVKPDGSVETPKPATPTPAPAPAPAPRNQDTPYEDQPAPIKRPSVKINEQQASDTSKWRRPQVTPRMYNPEPLATQSDSTFTAPSAAPEVETRSAETTRSTKPSDTTIPGSTPTRQAKLEAPAAEKPEPAKSAPAKPAAAAPKAETPKAQEPAEPKSRAMYQQATDMANRGENDTAAYWRAVAQHEKEQGRTAPNDFSDSSVGKFFGGLFGGKKVEEATKYLSINPSSTNMFAEAKKLKGDQYKLDKNKNNKLDAQDFKMLRGEKMEEEKKADKDYDGDGKVESSKDEVWGSRLKAAKKAGKLEEGSLKSKIVGVITGAGKKPEIELLNDPFRKSAYPPKMSTGEKAAIGAGAAAVGAVAAGEASKKEEPKTIQQSNNPTPRSATDRIRDNLGLDSPDYSPKTDPNYKPADTGPSDEDKAALDKKVKDAIKENYLHMLKRK